MAAGGDGSVNETAAALVAQNAPEKTAFAVVPLGTANDFATGLGIPQDPRDALLLAATDTASPIDIGTVNDEARRVQARYLDTFRVCHSSPVRGRITFCKRTDAAETNGICSEHASIKFMKKTCSAHAAATLHILTALHCCIVCFTCPKAPDQ